MKMMFFKVRAIAVFAMLAIVATCGMLAHSPANQIVEQKQQPLVFMKENNVKFIEKHPKNPKDFKELVDLAKKIGVDTNLLNVVPIFIIRNKIIIGFNPKEILCILANRACKTDFLRVKEAF